MKTRLLNLMLLSLTLISCNSNDSSKTSIDVTSLTSQIVDKGNFNEKETIYVEKVETSDGLRVLPFHTQMGLQVYSKKAKDYLGPFFLYHIKRLHILVDRYNYYKDENGNIINNLKVINDSYGSNKEIKVDEDLLNVLTLALELAKLTKGYFNPSMGNLIDAWEDLNNFSPFHSELTKEDDLSPEIVNSKRESIIPYDKLEDYIIINQEKGTVLFKKYEHTNKKVVLSLGGVAKGYAIDFIRKLFMEQNTPLIAQGSASSTYFKGDNPHPNRKKWRVVIESPYRDELYMGIPLLLIDIDKERTMSASGDSEQSFYYYNDEGKKVIRHHILNPFTGYSENYYRYVYLVATNRSDVLDGLSTALFNINDLSLIKEIVEDVEEYYDFEISFLLEKEVADNNLMLYMNEDFKNLIYSYENEDIKITEEII